MEIDDVKIAATITSNMKMISVLLKDKCVEVYNNRNLIENFITDKNSSTNINMSRIRILQSEIALQISELEKLNAMLNGITKPNEANKTLLVEK